MVHFWTIISKFILMMQSESFMAAAPFILDVLTYFLNIFKVWHFLFRKDEIWKIYEELEAVFDHPGDQWRDYGMKTYLDNYYRIMIIYAAPTIMILVVASLPIIPYLLFGKMDLLVEYWYPFDPMQPETFLFAYAFVVWVGINALITMLATDALLYCMVTVIAMEFNIFKIDLMSGLAASNSLGSRGFKALIDRHKRLMDISDRLERTYSESFLCSFVISSLVMCFVAFQLSRSSDRFDYYAYYFTYFWMMSAQILLLCLFGQKLIDSSQSVADGVYDCGWEGIEDEALKKQLVIIILRAQKGKRLTAMNFAEISLETFTSVRFSGFKIKRRTNNLFFLFRS